MSFTIPLNNDKSALLQKSTESPPPAYANTPPHWADFYQLPVENDIIAGAEWIYCLWTVLNRTNPSPPYCASSELDSTATELCTLPHAVPFLG